MIFVKQIITHKIVKLVKMNFIEVDCKNTVLGFAGWTTWIGSDRKCVDIKVDHITCIKMINSFESARQEWTTFYVATTPPLNVVEVKRKQKGVDTHNVDMFELELIFLFIWFMKK